MCSKNQEVDPLFAQFITKDFLIQRIFRVLRNSLFRTNDPYSKKQNGARSLQRKNLLRFLQGYSDHCKTASVTVRLPEIIIRIYVRNAACYMLSENFK